MMIQLKTDSLNHYVQTLPRLMVMFGTDWCGNCDILKPEFLKISQQKENREDLEYAKNFITELAKGTNKYDFITDEIFENDFSTFISDLKSYLYVA